MILVPNFPFIVFSQSEGVQTDYIPTESLKVQYLGSILKLKGKNDQVELCYSFNFLNIRIYNI